MDSSSTQLHHLAIQAALDNRWSDALKLNQEIIKNNPKNVDALNRQARAYFELGKILQAKKFYSLVLNYDPYNPIAQKNLKILKAAKKNIGMVNGTTNNKVTSSLFLQEPGKTKVVSLIKVAEPQKLSTLYCGMSVKMNIKNRKITILGLDNIYLGVVPDDIAHRLIRLVRGGNKYEVFIKSIRVNSLSVLIKETYRSKRFRNEPSFLDSSAFSPREIFTSMDSEADSEEEEYYQDEEEVVI